DGIRDFHVTGVQTCALPISFAALGVGVGGAGLEQRNECVAVWRQRRQLITRLRQRLQNLNCGLRGVVADAVGEAAVADGVVGERSEERRVGKEWRRRGSASE